MERDVTLTSKLFARLGHPTLIVSGQGDLGHEEGWLEKTVEVEMIRKVAEPQR